MGNIFRTTSYTWRSLIEVYLCLKNGLAWDVRDGKFVRFWLDDWLGEGRLIDLCLDTIHLWPNVWILDSLDMALFCLICFLLILDKLQPIVVSPELDQPGWTLDSE